MLTKQKLQEILEDIPDDVEIRIMNHDVAYSLEIDNVQVKLDTAHPENNEILLET